MPKKKKDKKIKHEVSKVTVKYKPINDRGWEEEGSGPDGYEEVNGYNVIMYVDGYYATTAFVSSDLHEITNHLKKVRDTIAYYQNKEKHNTILKTEYDFMKFLEDEETYYAQLLSDLESA